MEHQAVIEVAAACVLACVVGTALGAWWVRRRRVLPLERELSSARESVQRHAASARELRLSQERLEGGFSALHQVASTITAHPDQPTEMLEAIVAIIARAMEADLCAFLLYEESKGELATQPGAYGIGDDEAAVYHVPVTNQQSSSVRVFLTGQTFVTGDAQNDPRVIKHFAKLWRCHSLLVVPLTLEGKRIGVLRVGSFKKDFFTQDHIRLSEMIADEAVVLVESTMLTRKLSQANQRLSEINRLKDDFVSTVSHEFKTPLTAIKGFLSVLLEGEAGPVNEEQARFLGIARSSADRLTDLVSDLLDLAKLEAGASMDFGPVDMGALMGQCREDHALLAGERGIRLEVRSPIQPVVAWGDAKWLRQLLDNLVSNALKFTPRSGWVKLSAARKGETALVTVEDSGVGIGPEDRERIFERFYRAGNRASANAPGTGLGLAIAKYVIDRHEGRIWVESEPGKGSRFHFALPVARDTNVMAPSSYNIEAVPAKESRETVPENLAVSEIGSAGRSEPKQRRKE